MDRMLRKVVVIIVAALLLTSCAPSAMKINRLGTIDRNDKAITFLSNSKYTTDLTIALLKYKFDVKALPSQYAVTNDLSKETSISFDQASARYGLKLFDRPRDVCLFSRATISDFTISIIDIKANATVLIMEKTGPDGECPGYSGGPVWDDFAASISDNWK